MTVKEATDTQLEKAGEIRAYFQSRRPDCEVTCRRDDLTWRFYFVRDDRNAHIVDISRYVLADWSSRQIVSMLERARWEHILEANPHRVPHFTNNGIGFHQWPV